MNYQSNNNNFTSVGNSILSESVRYGPIVTFLIMGVIAFGAVYLLYSYLLTGWAESNEQYRQQVLKKELDNQAAEKMLADEPEFRERFKKIVGLYQEAKPLLPEETEVADVLGQVEMAARRNGVTLTGLVAVTSSVKSPKAAKLYEREIPAVVTGPYPQVVRFLNDISRMPRILLVRDYSVASLRNSVTAGFTLVAYHAPPPAEMPAIPSDIAETRNANPEVSQK